MSNLSSEPQNEAPFLPFARPSIGEAEIEAVTECLRGGWLTTGQRTRDFEAEFAEYVGVKHAVALNSCTAALHLALEAIGLTAADEVLVPTLTFAATAEVVRYFGARPVLLDCDPETFNLDLNGLRAFLANYTKRVDGVCVNQQTGAPVKALIPVHFGGLPCPMDEICALAREYGLHVIEDAAHAIPCEINGRSVGTFGTAGAFSFYATKNITTGEGGMLTTDDKEIADRVRMMSLHGISRDAWLRYTARGSWFYEILEPGFKYNLTDLASALGRVQLGRAEELWQSRASHAARYTEGLRRLSFVETPPEAPAGVQHSWHLYPLRLNLDRLKIDRAAFIQQLTQMNIGTSVHFIPLHLHPYYRDTYGYQETELPAASALYPRLISLPLYAALTEAEVDRVIDAVAEVGERNLR